MGGPSGSSALPTAASATAGAGTIGKPNATSEEAQALLATPGKLALLMDWIPEARLAQPSTLAHTNLLTQAALLTQQAPLPAPVPAPETSQSAALASPDSSPSRAPLGEGYGPIGDVSISSTRSSVGHQLSGPGLAARHSSSRGGGAGEGTFGPPLASSIPRVPSSSLSGHRPAVGAGSTSGAAPTASSSATTGSAPQLEQEMTRVRREGSSSFASHGALSFLVDSSAEGLTGLGTGAGHGSALGAGTSSGGASLIGRRSSSLPPRLLTTGPATPPGGAAAAAAASASVGAGASAGAADAGSGTGVEGGGSPSLTARPHAHTQMAVTVAAEAVGSPAATYPDSSGAGADAVPSAVAAPGGGGGGGGSPSPRLPVPVPSPSLLSPCMDPRALAQEADRARHAVAVLQHLRHAVQVAKTKARRRTDILR